MEDETHILMGNDGWWRRVEEAVHDTLTSTAHELPDETARILEYLALLFGALAHDQGLSEDDVRRLVAAIRERVVYCPDIIIDPVVSLVLAGYRGSADIRGA